jgi:hypothetical protein
MPINKDVWKIINGCRTSIRRADNRTVVNCEDRFKALPMDAHKEIMDSISNHEYEATLKAMPETKTVSEMKAASALNTMSIMSGHNISVVKKNIHDSVQGIENASLAIGGIGDPSTYTYAKTNVWINPMEAVSIYSQGGIPEIIIDKKTKSVMRNGISIKNKFLTARQYDMVDEEKTRLQFDNHVADALSMSANYGGSLMYPMFTRDNPATMHLFPKQLMERGILGKGCISRLVALDRWNTMHIPQTNPTMADWLEPNMYYIPFLGSDVNGRRTARIVTKQQPGYWGAIINMGWGLPDAVSWLESFFTYKTSISVMKALLRQMSILVRSFNTDGPLVAEMQSALQMLQEEETLTVREVSPGNPITMLDMVGDIKSIQHDFRELPSIMRFLREDLAGDAGLSEILLWNSEKSSFSGGDNLDIEIQKGYEKNEIMFKEVSKSLKNLANLVIISALGTGKGILEALPYTEIEFAQQSTASAIEEAEILEHKARAYSAFVLASMPLESAASKAGLLTHEEYDNESKFVEDLKKRQAELDKVAKEEHELEMKTQEANMENQRLAAEAKASEPKVAPKQKSPSTATKSRERPSKSKAGRSGLNKSH